MSDSPYLHPIQNGERVAVIRFGDGRPPFIEGTAIVQSTARSPDAYHVVFVGEQTSRERLVFREFQHDPERSLAMFRAIWRAENPGYGFDDFFPDTADHAEG